jgi:hypothetical protein
MSNNIHKNRHAFNIQDLFCLKCKIHLSIHQMEPRPCIDIDAILDGDEDKDKDND